MILSHVCRHLSPYVIDGEYYMKAIDIINYVNGNVQVSENSCDKLIAGDLQKEIKRIGVTMFPTVSVLKAVAEWGADMLIPHEPTYNHPMDIFLEDAVTNEKKRIVEDSGMVIYRNHDHAHGAELDLIYEGFIWALGLEGEFLNRGTFALKEAMTGLELAGLIEEKLRISHVRICGTRDHKTQNIKLCLGAPGSILGLLKKQENELVIIGETCEWYDCEYVRDCSQMGINKTMLVLGHVLSERDGMKLFTERLKQRFPELEIHYFESGDVYSYTD